MKRYLRYIYIYKVLAARQPVLFQHFDLKCLEYVSCINVHSFAMNPSVFFMCTHYCVHNILRVFLFFYHIATKLDIVKKKKKQKKKEMSVLFG